MIGPYRIPRQSLPGQRGFTIVETVVSTALLGILTIFVLGGLLFGMTQARGGQNRAAASSWAQAELDYLLLEGYSNLTVPTTRTLTQTSGYTAYGGILEPVIPAGADHAVISIQAVSGLSVKQVTVTLYQAPSSVYATLSTYISNYVHP
jgi:prepilin-type N-terminal cleavage/methylation domain-containing protein